MLAHDEFALSPSAADAPSAAAPLSRLMAMLDATAGDSAAVRLRKWIAEGLDALPHPGRGDTLRRWQALAAIAMADLSLVKLAEGHADALAILADAGETPLTSTPLAPSSSTAPSASLSASLSPPPSPPGATQTPSRPGPAAYGIWAAEAPDARVTFTRDARGGIVLHGRKAWCSGAAALDRALLTVWARPEAVSPDGAANGSGAANDADARNGAPAELPWLADVDLRHPGVGIDGEAWHAVGMAATGSGDVSFDGVPARLVGGAGFYLSRAGFWQGGAGIAACWHGAACSVARTLIANTRGASAAGPGWHRLMALGEVDRVLAANAALLREAAAWIDAHPLDDARAWALRTRASSDDAAQRALRAATRAMGAGPLCRDARFARLAADLPVFIRQCHGERDLVALGQAVLATLPSATAPAPTAAASMPAADAASQSTTEPSTSTSSSPSAPRRPSTSSTASHLDTDNAKDVPWIL